MDEKKKDLIEGDNPTEESVPLAEKNTTQTDETVNCLVSTVSSSVETVAQDLAESQPVVRGNEKSNRFQNK